MTTPGHQPPEPQPHQQTQAPQPQDQTQAQYGNMPQAQYGYMPHPAEPRSPKSRLAAILLAWFLGVLGAHRFYVGKTGTGLLWLFTLGFFGIGALVDLLLIAAGSFKDKDGLRVTVWLQND